MSMSSLCQRCGNTFDHWLVTQAEFNIGHVSHWKLQLCRECTVMVANAVTAALQKPPIGTIHPAGQVIVVGGKS